MKHETVLPPLLIPVCACAVASLILHSPEVDTAQRACSVHKCCDDWMQIRLCDLHEGSSGLCVAGRQALARLHSCAQQAAQHTAAGTFKLIEQGRGQDGALPGVCAELQIIAASHINQCITVPCALVATVLLATPRLLCLWQMIAASLIIWCPLRHFCALQLLCCWQPSAGPQASGRSV